jgi:hypothetical protein
MRVTFGSYEGAADAGEAKAAAAPVAKQSAAAERANLFI